MKKDCHPLLDDKRALFHVPLSAESNEGNRILAVNVLERWTVGYMVLRLSNSESSRLGRGIDRA